MDSIDKKRNQLRDTAFKLVYKHPYSMVRTKIDRIGRQIRELDNKFAKATDSDKQGNIGLGRYYTSTYVSTTK